MTRKAPHQISVITEMTDDCGERALFAFARAWALGALSAAVPAAFLFILPSLIALFHGDGFDPRGLMLVLVPLFVSGTITLVGMVAIGLPLTVILARRGNECPRIYAACGAGAGALFPLAVGLALGSWAGGFFLAVFGMVAGTTAARSWGRWRSSLRQDEAPGDLHENPFHDMIY